MGHLTTRDAYRNLGERINWFTQGPRPLRHCIKYCRSSILKRRPNGWRCCRYARLP